MSKNIFSDEAFADWIAKQPADKTYDYQNSRRCMIGQYLKDCGVRAFVDYDVISFGDLKNDWKWQATPKLWDKVCRGRRRKALDGKVLDPSWTYGKALKRIRKLMQEAA